MARQRLPSWRPQTSGEEVANALSHGAGCLLAVASLPRLVSHVAAVLMVPG